MADLVGDNDDNAYGDDADLLDSGDNPLRDLDDEYI
jgi:hypothetical protein